MSSTMRFRLLVIIGIVVIGGQVNSQGPQFWNDQAYDTIQKALFREETLNTNTAKNVVIFVGDGMGISTVTAARILRGQQAGKTGEETVLEWEKFSSVGLAKTYTTDRQVSDSAGTATAYFCGVKTKSEVIGLDDSALVDDCKTALTAAVDSVMISAERAGKATGFVTTTSVTDATPSALYAHSPQRDWENDAALPAGEAALGCTDIASQLISLGKNTKVIMGGGRIHMMPNTANDPEYAGKVGLRQDGRNLIDEWKAGKDSNTSHYVWNLEQFNGVDPKTTDYLMGLFEISEMRHSANRQNDDAGEPSLAQMTKKAIQILQKDENGFFLMVEGGSIDLAHHDGSSYHALHDTLALEEAVAMAMEMTDEKETLVIVTADHSHVFSIGGYPPRGNPILGKGALFDGSLNMDDGLPFTTLSYASGPGGSVEKKSYEDTGMRRDLSDIDTEAPEFLQPALVPMSSESHGGEDVAIYANGPMSHLFHGVHEQNYIAHVIRYAACLEEFGTSNAPSRGLDATSILVALLMLVIH